MSQYYQVSNSRKLSTFLNQRVVSKFQWELCCSSGSGLKRTESSEIFRTQGLLGHEFSWIMEILLRVFLFVIKKTVSHHSLLFVLSFSLFH